MPVHSNQHTTSQSLNLLSSTFCLTRHEQSRDDDMSLVIPNRARYKRDFGVRLYSTTHGAPSSYIYHQSHFTFHNSPNFFASLKVFYIFLTATGLTSESVNDNDELLSRARMLLVRMCGVTPPRPLIGSILKVIFDTILNSPVRQLPIILWNSHLPQ